MSAAQIAEGTSALGFAPDEEQCAGLAAYLGLLMRWNTSMNLVGARSWQEALDNLLVDSLYLGPFLERLPLPDAPLTWDLGAGAGLPGIPLRVMWQRGSYWMVEAREKRALFIANVLARLNLPDTHIYRGRYEQFITSHQAGTTTPSLILSRAFMPWEALLRLVGPRLAKGGIVVLLLNEVPDSLGPTCNDGLTQWEHTAHLPYSVASGGRVLCALTKTA